MAINSQTFAIITNTLIGKNQIFQQKFEKNRTKQGNPYYLVLFENRTKPGTVLSETVLSGDPLYLEFLYFLVQLLQQSLPNTYTQSVPSWFHDPLQNWLELLVRVRSLTTLPRSGKVGCAVKSMQIFPCNNSKGISSG